MTSVCSWVMFPKPGSSLSNFWQNPKALSHFVCLGLGWISQMSQTVKNLPEMQKTQVRSLGWEDPLKKVRLKCSLVSDSLRPHGLYSLWKSLGQNTGVDSLSLLQWIFPAQGLNPGLLHCRQILYQLSHKGSPRILEWVAYPFSHSPQGHKVSDMTGQLTVGLC